MIHKIGKNCFYESQQKKSHPDHKLRHLYLALSKNQIYGISIAENGIKSISASFWMSIFNINFFNCIPKCSDILRPLTQKDGLLFRIDFMAHMVENSPISPILKLTNFCKYVGFCIFLNSKAIKVYFLYL